MCPTSFNLWSSRAFVLLGWYLWRNADSKQGLEKGHLERKGGQEYPMHDARGLSFDYKQNNFDCSYSERLMRFPIVCVWRQYRYGA
jgi:hypothetical protein